MVLIQILCYVRRLNKNHAREYSRCIDFYIFFIYLSAILQFDWYFDLISHIVILWRFVPEVLINRYLQLPLQFLFCFCHDVPITLIILFQTDTLLPMTILGQDFVFVLYDVWAFRPVQLLIFVEFELKALFENWSAALYPTLFIFDNFGNKLLIDQILILRVILRISLPPPIVLVVDLLNNLTCIMLIITAVLWL